MQTPKKYLKGQDASDTMKEESWKNKIVRDIRPLHNIKARN